MVETLEKTSVVNPELARQLAHIREVRARIHGGHIVEPPPEKIRPRLFPAPKRRVVENPRDHWLARDLGAQHVAHCRAWSRAARARAGVLRFSDLVDTAADAAGVTTEDVVGHSHRWRHVRPRHVAMYLARELLRFSTVEIGRRIGARDHSSVLNAVRRVGENRGNVDALDRLVEDVLERLGLPNDAA